MQIVQISSFMSTDRHWLSYLSYGINLLVFKNMISNPHSPNRWSWSSLYSKRTFQKCFFTEECKISIYWQPDLLFLLTMYQGVRNHEEPFIYLLFAVKTGSIYLFRLLPKRPSRRAFCKRAYIFQILEAQHHISAHFVLGRKKPCKNLSFTCHLQWRLTVSLQITLKKTF